MILTEVRAAVPVAREQEVLDGYRKLGEAPVPDGLVQSWLLREDDEHWRIQTLWRDQAALDAMRSAPEPPAAPALFRSVGAEPVLTVLPVAAEIGG
ncbi:hypothetical protein AB0E69_22695 [Kribbella sp. NPDC026611]|uniref:hypothetical protein n=1 Tax=Kribbella sp. NPDC026611 TaxID=3154911 RepID=UPI0033E5FC14